MHFLTTASTQQQETNLHLFATPLRRTPFAACSFIPAPVSRPPQVLLPRAQPLQQLPNQQRHRNAPLWTSQNRQQRSSHHCHLHLYCICRNPNSGERKCTATCQAAIGQSNWSTGQHWSTGQSQQSTLVKTAKMVK